MTLKPLEQMQLPKNVHELSLVLVNALHLHIKEGLWIDSHPAALLDECRQALLVGLLDGHPAIQKARVVNVGKQPRYSVQVHQPVVRTEFFRD